MKCFPVVVLLGVALAAASPAWAQYGLYGSPDMLQLSPANSAAAPQYAYPGAPANPSYSQTPAHSASPVNRMPQPSVYPNPSRMAYAPQAKPQPSPRDAAPRKAPKLVEPVQPQGPGVVSQMLEESGAYPGTAGCDHYGYGTSAGGGCGMGGGYGDACSGYGCPPQWWARASWLVMGRDEPNTLWTSYETNNNPNQLPSDIGLEWGNGGEISFGHCFSGGLWGLEATYWGLDPLEGQTSVTHANTVSTPLDFSDVAWANPALPGAPVDLFDGADVHRLRRSNEFHNVELNMISTPFECGCGCDPCGCCRGLDINWLVGVRYFRFDERWAFHSLRGGGSWADPTHVGCLEDDIINNLVGFQFGFDVNYSCSHDLRLFVKPKFGIYNNHIKHTFRAFRGDGENFAPAVGSGVPGSYPVQSTVNALSFLTEVDLGLEWQVSQRWSAFVGYRVVAATGMGLADNQIPPYIVDIPELAAIDHNGQLILHGAFAGATFNF